MEGEENFSVQSIIDENITDENMKYLIQRLISKYVEEDWDPTKITPKINATIESLIAEISDNYVEGEE